MEESCKDDLLLEPSSGDPVDKSDHVFFGRLGPAYHRSVLFPCHYRRDIAAIAWGSSMGKSGKTKAAKSATKAEAKAAKKAKAASKAERSQNKKAKDLAADSSSKASKNKGKGKAKQKEVDDDEDLIQTLEEYRRRWEEGKCLLPAKIFDADMTCRLAMQISH